MFFYSGTIDYRPIRALRFDDVDDYDKYRTGPYVTRYVFNVDTAIDRSQVSYGKLHFPPPPPRILIGELTGFISTINYRLQHGSGRHGPEPFKYAFI